MKNLTPGLNSLSYKISINEEKNIPIILYIK